MTDTIRWQDIPHLDQKFELFQTPDGTVMGRKGSDLYETPITAVHFRTIIDAIDGKRDIGSIYQLLADRCPRDTLDLFFTECQAVFDTTATPSDLAEHAGDEPRAHPPKSVSSFSIAILGNLLGQSIHDRFAVAEWARCTPYSIDSFQSCLSEDFLASEASLTIRPASQRPETQSSPHRDRAYEQLEEATERQLLQICSRHNLVICGFGRRAVQRHPGCQPGLLTIRGALCFRCCACHFPVCRTNVDSFKNGMLRMRSAGAFLRRGQHPRSRSHRTLHGIQSRQTGLLCEID